MAWLALASRGLPILASGMGVGVLGGLASALTTTARTGVTVMGALGANIGGALTSYPLVLGSMLGMVLDHIISFLKSILQIGLNVIERMWSYIAEDPFKFLVLAVNLAILMS